MAGERPLIRRAVLLLLLAACGAPKVRPLVTAPGAASIREATVEVLNATGRELPAPRPGLFDEIGHVIASESRSLFSTSEAFAAAAAAGLRDKGIYTVSARNPEVAVFRVTIDDFEIRNRDTAGAVAFVSATYVLLDGRGEALWESVETRLPIRLGGPDLTRSELTRIATEAVKRALSSFPSRSHP